MGRPPTARFIPFCAGDGALEVATNPNPSVVVSAGTDTEDG